MATQLKSFVTEQVLNFDERFAAGTRARPVAHTKSLFWLLIHLETLEGHGSVLYTATVLPFPSSLRNSTPS